MTSSRGQRRAMRRSCNAFSWLFELGITSQQSRQKEFKQALFSLTIKYELLALVLQCSLFLWSVHLQLHTSQTCSGGFYGSWIPPATWRKLPPHTRILTVSSACVDLCVYVCVSADLQGGVMTVLACIHTCCTAHFDTFTARFSRAHTVNKFEF